MPHGSLINLRQEEYRYTQGLERVERPLTFALVSLIAFFLVDAVSQFQQGRARFRDAASLEGDDKHSSLVELAIAEIDRNLNQGLPESPPAGWRVRTDLTDFSPERYMNELRIRVLNSKRVLDEEVGAAGIPMSESSLDAWRLVMEVLQEEMGESQGRWMIERLKLTSTDAKGRDVPAKVDVELGLSVMGDQIFASRRLEGLKVAFKNKDWVVVTPTIKGSITSVKQGEGQNGTIAFSVSPSQAKEVDA